MEIEKTQLKLRVMVIEGIVTIKYYGNWERFKLILSKLFRKIRITAMYLVYVTKIYKNILQMGK